MSALTCARCGGEIRGGDAVEVVGPEFDEETGLVTEDEAVVVHADKSICDTEKTAEAQT